MDSEVWEKFLTEHPEIVDDANGVNLRNIDKPFEIHYRVKSTERIAFVVYLAVPFLGMWFGLRDSGLRGAAYSLCLTIPFDVILATLTAKRTAWRMDKDNG